jgi:hypothetical protein
MPALLLVWPYWFLLALITEGKFYQDTESYAVCYFLFFVSPIFFAFAAGAAFWNSKLAHAFALLCLAAIPSMYWNLRDNGMGNVWVMFNQPKDRFAFFPPHFVFAIFFLGLFALALGTSLLRLLPGRWTLRKNPISNRTWPAFVASVAFMIVWFCQSVMPYRIPGAVDYAGWPILQILHIEKRGLQVHETTVSVSGYKFRNGFDIRSVYLLENDRRLLQYRFAHRSSTAELTDSLREQIRAMLSSSVQPHPEWEWDQAKPVRDWNADNWYVIIEGGGMKAYTKQNNAVPPPAIVNLFNDLEKLPQTSPGQMEMRDVCLGFCYDPLSAMGYLYANHRCHNNGQGTVCR